jgi:cytochrome P450
VRLALKDTTLPHGGGADGLQPVGVLKGSPVGYSTLAMQRREDIYPDPSTGFAPFDEFEPQRWFGWTPRSWTYIPFNGGPRICIGQQFALTEMAYTVTRMLQRYERIENRMPEKPKFRSDIVLQPASPVLVDFYEVGSEKA